MKIYLHSPQHPRKPFFMDYATTISMHDRIRQDLELSWYWYMHGIIDIYEFIELRYGMLESYAYDRNEFNPFNKKNFSL